VLKSTLSPGRLLHTRMTLMLQLLIRTSVRDVDTYPVELKIVSAFSIRHLYLSYSFISTTVDNTQLCHRAKINVIVGLYGSYCSDAKMINKIVF